MNKALLALVFFLAAALAAALVIRNNHQEPPAELSAEIESLRATTTEALELRNDIAELRAEVAELNRLLASARTSSPRQPAIVSAGTTPQQPASATQPDVAELKETVDQIRSGLVRTGLVPPGTNEVSSSTAVIMSQTASAEEKLMALRTLRSANARSDDVVRQMVQAYYATENPAVRADIFRQLDGVTTPELKTPLLEAVSKAADAGVREEAAETLAHYLPDEDVKTWLEYLAANDPNERVRGQAAESLQPSSR